jgi:hypothetical protein
MIPESEKMPSTQLIKIRELGWVLIRPSSRQACRFVATNPCLMPEMVRPSQMRKENQAHRKQRHEKIILSDHDALLLLSPIANKRMAPRAETRCVIRNTLA